ncbi:hypothetical protein [Burkholderia stagnalis]|nr:hypothetical protein [Burkholderia stagnalis]
MMISLPGSIVIRARRPGTKPASLMIHMPAILKYGMVVDGLDPMFFG